MTRPRLPYLMALVFALGFLIFLRDACAAAVSTAQVSVPPTMISGSYPGSSSRTMATSAKQLAFPTSGNGLTTSGTVYGGVPSSGSSSSGATLGGGTRVGP